MSDITEAGYPISFREADAHRLGNFLRQHESVVLFGMKRVGISNFLRFFLNHPEVEKTYIQNGTKHIFITVDLNDLVERDLFPFWTLLLKRIVDRIEEADFPPEVKAQGRKLFIESIQLKDLFFTVDTIGKVLGSISNAGWYPTLFLLRFDRLQQAATPEFFSNLQGLKEQVQRKMSYVITSFRPLHEIAPDVFKKSLLSGFSRDMYLQPAPDADMAVILDSYLVRYRLDISDSMKRAMLDWSGGHVQYLQLALVKLHERPEKLTEEELFTMLTHDEEVTLQSEELYESLTAAEREMLLAVRHNHPLEKVKLEKARYLLDTGMVAGARGAYTLFNPLFDTFVANLTKEEPAKKDFTKKEHLLLTYLETNEGELCERDGIIEAVWPENKDLSVSDWSIDRLVSRVRTKLKHQASPLEIVTVKTRGYKLMRR